MASLLSDLITNHSSAVAAHPLFVGFGTAALGSLCHDVVLQALEAGFRHFDTAEEHEHWYHPAAVGTALQAYAESRMSNSNDSNVAEDDECVMVDDEDNGAPTCLGRSAARQRFCQELHISTKIPPWELTSMEHIRSNAAQSRAQLVGCCDADDEKFPLDIYYIHAPACWKGWHPRCDDAPPTLDLRSVWLALEAVVGLDHAARRIGLSNVRPDELLDIIQFVRERTAVAKELDPSVAPPRMPDAVQSFADPIAPAEELRKICREHGIQFVSYSTLGTQHIYRSKLQENPVLTHPIVLELAEQYQRSTAEVVVSWALQHHMSVIPRSSRREHIRELARLLPNKQEGIVGFLDAADLTRMDFLKGIL
jgi:diketogulonate reductase-like aldo/keto reductase